VGTLGRILVLGGAALVLAGLLLLLLGRFPLPWGRLPGDLAYRGKNLTVFVPLGTMILVSLFLTLILNLPLLLRFLKK
jgi:hypothetical protein